jgi:hypothetical protein
VPSIYFSGSTWQQVFLNVLGYLTQAFDNNEVDSFTTQSGIHILIGNHPVQWSKSNAQEFVSRLGSLWQNYYE